MDIEAKTASMIEVFEGIKENVPFFLLEIDLRKYKDRAEQSEYLKKIEDKINEIGYNMVLYEDKNRKGLYQLHFRKPVGELEHA